MIPIHKNNEPQHLQQYRLQPDAQYDGANFTPVKQQIRESLVEEQGYLCAYCMSRIEPNSKKMKIEHWHSQSPSRYPEEQLIYSNMLGCCCGNEGLKPNLQHCDTAKGDKDLLFNPSYTSHHNRLKIRYLGSGTIASDDSEFDDQLNNILNLNFQRLKENRQRVWKIITKELSKQLGTVSSNSINRFIEKWKKKDRNGRLPEYCGVAIYYLNKKLKRIS